MRRWLRDFRPRTQDGYMLAVRQFLDRMQRRMSSLIRARQFSSVTMVSSSMCGDVASTLEDCLTVEPDHTDPGSALIAGVVHERQGSPLGGWWRTSAIALRAVSFNFGLQLTSNRVLASRRTRADSLLLVPEQRAAKGAARCVCEAVARS
jgi:hypothetical protein